MTVIEPNYGFPARYDENYLVILVRDPHCIFGYWEFSGEQMDLVAREFHCQWGEVPLLLRVYDLTGLNFTGENEHSHFDIKLHPLANNYYINNVNSNNSYCADIGVITSQGRFVTLVRSNVVQTPRDSLADGSGAVMADLLDRLIIEKQEETQQNRDNFAGFASSDGVYMKTSEQ